jgi:hypothetical protein
MRTQNEIDSEIAALRTLKPQVPSRTDFCEDSRMAIAAEISVLENRLSIDEILDRNEINPAHANYFTEEQRDFAIEARVWLDGGGFDESPSECWATYVL